MSNTKKIREILDFTSCQNYTQNWNISCPQTDKVSLQTLRTSSPWPTWILLLIYRQLVRRWRCWATCCCTFVGHLHENMVETLPLKSVGPPTTWLSLLQRFPPTRNTRTETQSTNWSNVSKSQHHTQGNNIHIEDLLTFVSCEVPHLTLRFFWLNFCFFSDLLWCFKTAVWVQQQFVVRVYFFPFFC